MTWEILAVVAVAVILFIGTKRRTSYVGEFIIGILYGLWWEFLAESRFNYTGFSIYIYKDIPLAIILIWGVAIAGFLLISDYLQSKYVVFKKGKYKNLKNCLLWDTIVAMGIGWAMEISGSQLLGMWNYPVAGGTYILGVPLGWLLGWVFVGIFVLAFVRRYQELFEIKWLEKKIEKKR